MKRVSIVLWVILIVNSAFAQQKKSNITVSMPEGWIKVENSVLEHQYMKKGASFMIKEETMLNGKSLDDAITVAKQKIGNYFDNYKLLKEESVTVDGITGKSITYNYSVRMAGMTMNMATQTVYVMVKGKCQTLTFGAMESEFSKLASDIQEIIKSIQFNAK